MSRTHAQLRPEETTRLEKVKKAMTAVLDEKVREAILERVPMSKFGSPDDIAHTAVFLAMEPTGYMTGQVLTVDGGMVM